MAFGLTDRRSVLAGLGALTALRPALADDAKSPVARGLLAHNALAQKFESAPDLPDVTVNGPKGEQKLADVIKGHTVLLPIWAEWCVPCLTEIPDFARLQQVYGKSGKFAIIPVLSGTKKQMTPEATARLFAALNASIFEPLIEEDYGARLATVMARKGNNVTIPCNVLIGPDGRVVGREFGLASNHEDDDGEKEPKSTDVYARVQKAASGETQSLWGTSAGDEFAIVMASGFFS